MKNNFIAFFSFERKEMLIINMNSDSSNEILNPSKERDQAIDIIPAIATKLIHIYQSLSLPLFLDSDFSWTNS